MKKECITRNFAISAGRGLLIGRWKEEERDVCVMWREWR